MHCFSEKTLKVKLYQQMLNILAPTPLIPIVPVEYLFSQSRVHLTQHLEHIYELQESSALPDFV